MAPPGIGADGTRVEGVHAVAAAIEAGRVQRLLVERAPGSAAADLVAAAESRGVPIETVDDLTGLTTTGSPQGVMAMCRPLPRRTLDEAVVPAPAAVMVLDHVVDPRNTGAVARSAVAAGFGSLVVSDRRAAPLSAAAFKAAAGALEHIAVVRVSSIAAGLEQLRRLGVWIVALDAAGDRPLFGLELLTEPVAIVVGEEGAGLGRLVRDRSDVVASIPIHGPVESLNVSVAAALAAYEVARVRSQVADSR